MNHKGTVTLETERLTLRRFRLTDAEDALRYWLSYPLVTYRYQLDGAYADLSSVEAQLVEWINSYSSDHFYKWAIEERASGACMGEIYLWDINEEDASCETGYALGEVFGNKGYMTEACNAVIRFCFEALCVKKLRVCTRSSNVGSQKVIAKCGFSHIKTDENALWENGVQVDRYFYTLTRDAWGNA